MELVPPELREVLAAQAIVDESRRVLAAQSSRRNKAFAKAVAKGYSQGDLAELTGLTRQAISKAIRDG